MAYKLLGAAVLALLIVILLPSLLTTQENTQTSLSDADVQQIAENYVETNIDNSTALNSIITSRQNGLWRITVTYEQVVGENCKIGKCHWEGPASQFCRIESNRSLGECE
ncbi:hypothetical protein HY571_01005 [Candidatus Micrarchaeota archaeon]|nr:hypothetical protein [Candidatus Micrarchaeota archaeon]